MTISLSFLSQNRKVDSGSDPVVWHSFGKRSPKPSFLPDCCQE